MNRKKEIDLLYISLGGVFIASLITCNLIFQKFFEWEIWLPIVGSYTFRQSVGILPYPITFLVTDLISEFYGRERANQVVISGLLASVFMLLVVTLADHSTASSISPVSPVSSEVFSAVFGLSSAAVFSSMMAYLFAQFVDVRIFHFWKRFTGGRHLWLRNNGSTIFSQFIDTFTVLFLLCALSVIDWDLFPILLLNGFFFKVIIAFLDTPIFYGLSYAIRSRHGLALGEEFKS